MPNEKKKLGRPRKKLVVEQDSAMDTYCMRLSAWHVRMGREAGMTKGMEEGCGNLSDGVRKAIEYWAKCKEKK